MEWREIFEFVVAGFLQIFVCIFGIIGNSISVVVLTRPEMKSSVNVLLLGLALADTLYLVGRIFIYGLTTCLEFFELNYQYEDFFETFISSPAVTCVKLGEL